MRIVAGIYKGRNINAPEGDSTRPTSDKTRESIFNILTGYFYDANVLDIFAGSGALGIEALSRGAKKATFIDLDNQAIKTIKGNISNLKIENATVIQNDYKIISTLNESFDLIMLDPPYKMDVFDEILKIIEDNNLLNPFGVIVYESNQEHKLDKEYEGYKLKTYKYGIAFVNILFKLK